MATKKKKHKASHQVSIPDLLTLAEEQWRNGRSEDALNNLRRAETELKKYQSSNPAKKITIPPHIVAARTALPSLLARAIFAHSFNVADPMAKLSKIEEALKLMPGEVRYLIARGACRLLIGETESARSDFQRVREVQPQDDLAATAVAIAASAAQGALPDSTLTFTTQLSSSLLSGLRELAADQAESASVKLTALPLFDHNPSRAEVASLATQLFYSGALQFAAHDFNRAASDFNEALRLAQERGLHLSWQGHLAPYYHKIAEGVFESNRPLAVECWQHALLLAPQDKIAANNLAAAKRMQAQQAWNAGEIKQAAMLWQEALSAKPQDEQLIRNLAVAFEKLGDKNEAIVHWRALTRSWRQQAKESNGGALIKERLLQLEEHLINLMLETGSDEQEIVNELEAALKLDAENYELRQKTAEILLEVGKPRQALKHLQMIEKGQGASVDLLVRKAEAFDLLYRQNDARKTFERALELDPSSPIARRSYIIFLGHEAMRADDDDNIPRAAEICRKQLSIDPNYVPALTHLASLFLEEGIDDEAIALIDRILAANPQSARNHITAGEIYLSTGRKKEADKLFQKAIELEPSAICFYNIAVNYWECDYEKEALKYFDRTAETGDIDMLIDIAINLFQDGAEKDAERYLKRVMELDPTHPIPHLIKGFALMSGTFPPFLSPKTIKEAASEFEEAERLMVGREDYKVMLSEIHEIRGEIEQTIAPDFHPLFGESAGIPFEDFYFSGSSKPKKKKKRK